MQEVTFDQALDLILAADPRYKRDAYLFVRDARLAQLGDEALHGRDIHGQLPLSRRTARQACGASPRPTGHGG